MSSSRCTSPSNRLRAAFSRSSSTPTCTSTAWWSCWTTQPPQTEARIETLRAQRPEVVILRNPLRQGFVASVNRAMASSRRDVILLNSDTRVSARWVEKLAAATASAPEIATVTPFSNHATIARCRAFWPSTLCPATWTWTILRDGSKNARAAPIHACRPASAPVCSQAAGMDEIGLFDEAGFGLGYGKEADFCMRASARGFLHVLDDATFVFHEGQRSFGATRRRRVKAAERVESAGDIRSIGTGSPASSVKIRCALCASGSWMAWPRYGSRGGGPDRRWSSTWSTGGRRTSTQGQRCTARGLRHGRLDFATSWSTRGWRIAASRTAMRSSLLRSWRHPRQTGRQQFRLAQSSGAQWPASPRHRTGFPPTPGRGATRPGARASPGRARRGADCDRRKTRPAGCRAATGLVVCLRPGELARPPGPALPGAGARPLFAMPAADASSRRLAVEPRAVSMEEPGEPPSASVGVRVDCGLVDAGGQPAAAPRTAPWGAGARPAAGDPDSAPGLRAAGPGKSGRAVAFRVHRLDPAA